MVSKFKWLFFTSFVTSQSHECQVTSLSFGSSIPAAHTTLYSLPHSPGDTCVHSLRACWCWVSVCSCWILAGRLFIQSWVNSKFIVQVMIQVSYSIVLMTFYHPLTAQEASKEPKRCDSVFTMLNFAFFKFHAVMCAQKSALFKSIFHAGSIALVLFSKCYSTLSYILSKCSNSF